LFVTSYDNLLLMVLALFLAVLLVVLLLLLQDWICALFPLHRATGLNKSGMLTWMANLLLVNGTILKGDKT
jgi:hypothetical protein